MDIKSMYLAEIEPISYTHLDVYKRQSQMRSVTGLVSMAA